METFLVAQPKIFLVAQPKIVCTPESRTASDVKRFFRGSVTMKRAAEQRLAPCPRKLLKTAAHRSKVAADEPSSRLSEGLPRLMELLQHELASIRLQALALLHSHLEIFTCNHVFFETLPTFLLNRMWTENSAHVAQQVIRTLASMAILSRRKPVYAFRLRQGLDLITTEEDTTPQGYPDSRINLDQIPDEKQNLRPKPSIIQSVGSHAIGKEFCSTVVHNIMLYFQENHFQGISLQLQILRSLKLMAEEVQAVPVNAVNKISKLLTNSNPFIRAHVLQLIAAVLLTDPNVKSLPGKEHLTAVFHEYTRDSSVYVRKSALQSQVLLCCNGYFLTKECYVAASLLLHDLDEEVRSLSLHVIKLWVEQRPDENTNDAFIQVCKLMIDMDFSVRIEACKAFTAMKNVKEELVLQALSKQPLGLPIVDKEPLVFSLITIPETDVDVSKYEQGLGVLDKLNMGAFVHGIEDEFYEVRALTVKALEGMYGCSTTSRKMILEVVINMLNDDSKHVRLCALHALIRASDQYGLPIKDSDLHTFHAMLEDIDENVRSLGMKLLGQIQLSSQGFKYTTEILRNYMCKNPQEDGVIYTLYRLGKGHEAYLQLMIRDLVKELRPLLSADRGIDAPCCRCILTLFCALSEGELSIIPSHMLSLTQLFKQNLHQKHQLWDTATRNSGSQVFRSIESINLPSKHPLHANSSNQKKTIEKLLEDTIRSAWTIKNMLKHKMIASMKQVLSGCRKDLRSLGGFNLEEDQVASTTLTMYYIECIALILQGWIHFHCKSPTFATPCLPQLASRLDYIVTYMLHAYVGYAPEQKFSLLEMGMIPSMWKLTEKFNERDYKRLLSIVMTIHRLNLPSTHFTEEVRKHILNTGSTDIHAKCKYARQLVSSFWPMLLSINGSVTQLKVDLAITNIDPLPFLPGLSVGITISVSSQNFDDRNRVWVCVQLDSSWRQFMFIDTECLGKVDKMVTTIQVPGIPNVSECTLKATAVLECPSTLREKVGRGPNGYILPLSRAKEIRLISKI